MALLCRNTERARKTTDWLSEHTESTGAKFWRSLSICGAGCIDILDGNPKRGLPILREGIEAFTSTGAQQHLPLFKIFEAEGQLKLASTNECWRLLDEAHKLVSQTEQRFYLPEIHHLRGLASASVNENGEAEKHIREAIQTAKQQRSRSWELRSLISLVRILLGEARVDEARNDLRVIYDGIEKGDDLPDLAAAATMLA